MKTACLVLVGLSVTLYLVGMGLTTIFAPCFQPGAWITLAALALTALSFITILIAAIMRYVLWTWVAGAALGGSLMLMFAYLWTLLLCRGV